MREDYLAEKYGVELMPRDLALRALVYQWSLWAITNVQPLAMDIMNHVMLFPEAERVPRIADQARVAIPRYLDVLEGALQNREFLVGSHFTLADLNVVSAVNLVPAVGIDLAGHPSSRAWLDRQKARPAYRKAAARG